MSSSKSQNSALVVNSFFSGIIENANFRLQPSETLVVMGPSGSGKSCLLKGIADLMPNRGEVYLGNEEKGSVSPVVWRRKVQLVPAESRWWYTTAAEHFKELPDEKLLAAVHLTADDLEKQINHLSTGQKQRLVLLRSFQTNPRVMLLDEPTASLDERSVIAVEKLIADYQATHGTIVIWVTHSLEQAKRLGDSYLQLPSLEQTATIQEET